MENTEFTMLGRTFSKILAYYYLRWDHPAKLRILHALFRLMKWRVTVPYAEKAFITLDPTDGVEAGILHNGFYEPEVWDALSKFAVSNEVLWDVGANIGGVSIRAALDKRIVEVHSFEPNPKTFRILKSHVKLNAPAPIYPHHCALSNRLEERNLYFGDEGNSGIARFIPLKSQKIAAKVNCLTVDEVIKRGKAKSPTLMKIDVEGWEINVLEGALELFKTKSVKALVFESESDQKGNLVNNKIIRFLEQFGYTIEHIPRSYPQIEQVENYLAYLK